MVATPPATFLGQRFADYHDQWRAGRPSADAVDCRDLEERLTYALHLYQIAQDAAEAVGRRMAASGVAYDLEGARYVEALLTLWIAPAPAALADIAALEAKGFVVDHADEYRAAVQEARVSLSIPVERAAAQAERIAREGFVDTKTTEQLRRELRDRVGR